MNEETFSVAFEAYGTTLEPVASIARRFNFDYQSFKYHVEQFHPELVESRLALKEPHKASPPEGAEKSLSIILETKGAMKRRPS